MKEKLKLYGLAALFMIVVVCVAVAAFTLLRSHSLLAALPKPDETRPYAIADTREGCFPTALSSLLTDGMYAYFRNGTSRNGILLAAATADECAVLLQELPDSSIELYAALKFSPSDMKLLKKGELPEPLKLALPSPSVSAGAEKDTWLLSTAGADSPIYIKTERKYALFAADEAAFKRLRAAADGECAKIKWLVEKDWPGHIEFSDGGLLASDGEEGKPVPPLKLQASWQKTAHKKNASAGDARWKIIGAEKRLNSSMLEAFVPEKWDLSSCIVTEPMLLSVGVNLRNLKGTPDDWPFPLSMLGEMGRSMKLSDAEIRDTLAGRVVLSLGGLNRLLWFTLPGFVVSLTGDEKELNGVVTKFWENMFFGAEPKPLKGFDYGGAAAMPFSVIGAGRGDTAILGMAAPESLSARTHLGRYIKPDEKIIGWAVADLPRIGAALSEMTKMSSLSDEEDEDFTDEGGYFSLADPDGDEPLQQDGTEPFQPDSGFSPFDQGISDSFGNVLKELGKVFIVWEKPDSGRVHWYKSTSKESTEKK